jgi:hypothetical protein
MGLKESTDEIHCHGKTKLKIGEINKSVQIRDSDKLCYCEGTWGGIEGGNKGRRRVNI